MHLSEKIIRDYLNSRLDADKALFAKKHLESCEFCQELLKNIKILDESLQQTQTDLPSKAQKQLTKIYFDSLKGKTIEIVPLFEKEAIIPNMLAADGTKEESLSGTENICTLFSEDPEIVLRIMRDHDNNQNYMQLITEEKELSSYVMIQIPELDYECLTDDAGKALISGIELEKVDKLKWQIKMPDAVFSLEPMTYDPDKTEYSKEIELETDNKDKIRVKFERKTEGKHISIKILELDGNKDYGDIKISIIQQGESITKNISGEKDIIFELCDPEAEINIRLFHS